MGFIEAGIMGLTTVVATFGYVLFVPFVIMYVLEEIRGRRAGDRDPQLGAKLISTLFLSVAFQAALAGFAALLAGLVDDRLGGDIVRKNAMGMLFGGLAAGAMPLLVYRKVAGNGHVRFARQALGVNAIITGAAATVAIISTSLVFFNEGGVAAGLVVVVIYVTAALLCVRPLLAPEKA